MESKKGRPAPRWQVILELMRSHNRATIEAVEASRASLEQRIDLFEHRTEARFTVVEAAIGSMRKDLAGIRGEVAAIRGELASLRTHVTLRRQAADVAGSSPTA